MRRITFRRFSPETSDELERRGLCWARELPAVICDHLVTAKFARKSGMGWIVPIWIEKIYGHLRAEIELFRPGVPPKLAHDFMQLCRKLAGNTIKQRAVLAAVSVGVGLAEALELASVET